MMQQPEAPMPEEQAPPAPEGAPKEGEGNPAEVVSDLQKALFELNKGVQGSQLPKEAQAALNQSLSAYNKFQSILGQSMGVDMPAAEDEAPTAPGVMDAQVAGKGVRPVPSM